MTVDWKQAKGGTVSEGFTAEKLDVDKEYVLELVETNYQENVQNKFQTDTWTDRFETVWQVEGHKTKVWIYFNLPLGYLRDDAGPNEKSNVVKFAKRFRAVPKDQPFRLIDHFQEHMRIRAYLKKQEKSDYYNVDLDTVGPYNQPEPSQANRENQILVNTLKMYATRDEAFTALKQIAPEKEAQFDLLWSAVLKEREGTPKKQEPIIEA